MRIIRVVEKVPTLGQKHRLIIYGRDIPKDTQVSTECKKIVKITSTTWVNPGRIDVFFKTLRTGTAVFRVNDRPLTVRIIKERPKLGWLLIPLIPTAIIIYIYVIYSIFKQ